jgi:polyferredoxin
MRTFGEQRPFLAQAQLTICSGQSVIVPMLTVLGIITLLFMLYFNRFFCSLNCIRSVMRWT